MRNFVRRDVQIINLQPEDVYTAKLYAIRQTEYGNNYIFQNEAGELGLLYSKQILDQNIFAADIGNTFMIRYNGKQTSEKGRDYHSYDIGVCYNDGASPAVYIEPYIEKKSGVKNGKQQHGTQKNQTADKQDNLPF